MSDNGARSMIENIKKYIRKVQQHGIPYIGENLILTFDDMHWKSRGLSGPPDKEDVHALAKILAEQEESE